MRYGLLCTHFEMQTTTCAFINGYDAVCTNRQVQDAVSNLLLKELANIDLPLQHRGDLEQLVGWFMTTS